MDEITQYRLQTSFQFNCLESQEINHHSDQGPKQDYLHKTFICSNPSSVSGNYQVNLARPNNMYCKYRRDTTPCAVIGCNMWWEALIPSGARCRWTEEGWGSLTAPAEVNNHRLKDVLNRESVEPIWFTLGWFWHPLSLARDPRIINTRGGEKFPGCHLAHGQMTSEETCGDLRQTYGAGEQKQTVY